MFSGKMLAAALTLTVSLVTSFPYFSSYLILDTEKLVTTDQSCNKVQTDTSLKFNQ